MTTGSGLALLGIWIAVAACVQSPKTNDRDLSIAIGFAVVATLVMMIFG